MVPDERRILLIEDNQDDVDLTLRALGDNETIVTTVVRDGAEALDYILKEGTYKGLEEPSPDLILFDVNLPKLNSLEVLKELRRIEETRLLPVVLLTTSRQDEDIEESYAGSANSYLQFHESLHQQAFGERMRVGTEALSLLQYLVEMQLCTQACQLCRIC